MNFFDISSDLAVGKIDFKKYFHRYGGTALGLQIAKEISENIRDVKIPRHNVIETSQLLAGNHKAVQLALEPLFEKAVICRVSNKYEAFSSRNIRGANSSLFSPRFVVNDQTTQELAKRFTLKKLVSNQAIVLQEIVQVSNGMCFLVHAGIDEVIVEIRLEEQSYLFVSTGKSINHRESTLPDRSTNKIEAIVDIEKFINLQRLIQCHVGFPVNTEGFYENGIYTIRQLRPIPNDVLVDRVIEKEINTFNSKGYSDVMLTYFAWGRFDVKGNVNDFAEALDMEANSPLIVAKPPKCELSGETLSRTTLERLRSLDILQKEGFIPIEIYNEARYAVLRLRPWDDPSLEHRLLKKLSTVVVDFEDGFHLNHKPELLPPPGPLRDNYACISVPWLHRNLAIGTKVRVLCDGKRGLFCIADSETNDRRRTVMVRGQRVNFIHLDPKFIPPTKQVTSVAVVPFTKDGKIVVAQQSRGVDLPGGHVKEGDKTLEDTARREALEEASITLKHLHLVRVIQSDYYGEAPENLTYMVVFVAFVDSFETFNPSIHSSARHVMATDKFLTQYSAGDQDDMRDLVYAAQKLLFNI